MISQVVMSVARVFYYLAPPSQHHKMVRPLLRLLAMSLEAERVVLAYILSISHTASVRFVQITRLSGKLSDRSTCSHHIIRALLFVPMTARK